MVVLGSRRRRWLTTAAAAVLVYFSQSVHKLFAFRLGRGRWWRLRGRWRFRRCSAALGKWLRLVDRRRERRRPHGWQKFLWPGVELLGRLLLFLLLLDNGSAEELFFLLETFFYPGHDDGVDGWRWLRRTTVLQLTVQPVVGRRVVGRHLQLMCIAARHPYVHAVSGVRIVGLHRRWLVPVVRVTAATSVRVGDGRTPDAGRAVRWHESSCCGRWRFCATYTTDTANADATADAATVLGVVPNGLVDGAGIATTVMMETQFTTRCHSRFQATGPLVRFGIVSCLTEILRSHTKFTMVIILWNVKYLLKYSKYTKGSSGIYSLGSEIPPPLETLNLISVI